MSKSAEFGKETQEILGVKQQRMLPLSVWVSNWSAWSSFLQ
jgi:hypothetical protein